MYPKRGIQILLPCPQKSKQEQQYQHDHYHDYSPSIISFPFVAQNQNNDYQDQQQSQQVESDDQFYTSDLSRASIYEFERSDNNQYYDQQQQQQQQQQSYYDGPSYQSSDQSSQNEGIYRSQIVGNDEQQWFPPELIGFDYSRAVAREQSQVPSPLDQNGYQTEFSTIQSEGECSEDPLNWSSDMGWQVFSCTNLARTNPQAFQAQLGRCYRDYAFPRQPLQDEYLLEMSATQHSSDMAVHNTISHFGSDGSSVAERVGGVGYPFSLVGENVLFNRFWNASALELVGQWWCSEGHYQNMVACRYSQIGVSVVIGDSGYFATQHLGCSQNQQDCNTC